MATASVMSGVQFDALPYEEERKWELVDGELVAVPSPTPEHQAVVGAIYASLRSHFQTCGIGEAFPDVKFALNETSRLRPDVSILLHERWKNLDRRKVPIPGAPNIAIEVISPSERTTESTRKVWTYLRSGAQEVWQIYPQSSTLVIYATNVPIRVLNAGDVARTALLPGWEMLVQELVAS